MKSTISNNNTVNFNTNGTVSDERLNVKLDDTSTWVYPLTEEQLNIIRDRIVPSKLYETFDSDIKKQYTPFVPTNNPIKTLLDLLRQFNVIGSLLAPIFELMNNMPNPNPLQKLVTIMETINKFFDILSTIKSLKDVPIIGTLVSPLIDIFLVIWDIIVSIILLILSLVDGKLFALLKSEEFWKDLGKQLSTIFDSRDQIQSIITGLEDPTWADYLIDILGEEEVTKLKLTILKSIKPLFQLLDTLDKMVETYKTLFAIEEELNPLGEKSTWAKVCKFIFDRTPKEMLQGSKELNKKMAGPLKIMDDLAEGIEQLTQTYYITSDDRKILEAHKKKVDELKQKAKKKELIDELSAPLVQKINTALETIRANTNISQKKKDEVTLKIVSLLKNLDATLQNFKLPEFWKNNEEKKETLTLIGDSVLEQLKQTSDINKDIIKKMEGSNNSKTA